MKLKFSVARKVALALLAAVFLAAAAGAAAYSARERALVSAAAFNGGFECETGALPSGWDYSDDKKASADKEVFFGGKSSLRVTFEDYVNPFAAASREKAAVDGGEQYRFSVMAMSRSSRYSQAVISVTQYAADGSVVVAEKESPSLLLNTGEEWSGWQEIWLKLKLNLKTTHVGISVKVTAGRADCRFDNVTARPNDAAFYEDFRSVSSDGGAALWTVSGDAEFTEGELRLGAGSATADWNDILSSCTYEIAGNARSSGGASVRVDYISYRGETAGSFTHALPAGDGMETFSFAVTAPSAAYAKISLVNESGSAAFGQLSVKLKENPRETRSGWLGEWISCGGEEAFHGTEYRYRWFRKSFSVEKKVERAVVQYTGDDRIEGYINGGGSLGSTTFYSTVVADVTDEIRQGDNVLAFYVASGGDFCAIIFDMTIVYEDGTVERVYSDETTRGFTREAAGWKTIYFNDAGWPASRFFGRVPCQPWGTIDYSYVVPAGVSAELNAFDCGTSVAAGDALEVTLSVTPQTAAAENPEISAALIGEEGELPFSLRLVPAEGTDMTSWKPGETVRVEYVMEIPDFTQAGTYGIKLDAQDIYLTNTDGNIVADAAIAVTAAPKELISSEVKKDENGVTRLYIEGEKVVPMIYLRDFSTKFSPEYAAGMAEAGVVLMEFPNTRNYYMNGLGPVWTGVNQYDFKIFDDLIYETLEGAPHAKIMLALDADPPEWWLNANPGERAVDNEGNTYQNGASYASEKWREAAGEYFRAILTHAAAQPYADHIFAVKISAGATCEWQQYGVSLTTCGDFSTASRNAFRAWLKEKYGSDRALKNAWGRSVTLASAEIPALEERQPSQYKTVLGADQRNVIDYHLFCSDMITESILYLSGVVKEVCQNKWIVGTYNGYMVNSLTYESTNLVNASFRDLLTSDKLDFFCAPVLYDSRMSGMSAGYMTMVDSILDNGKMFFMEVDERTVLYDDSGWQDAYLLQEWGQTYTMRDTIEMLKRDFSNVLAKGAGLWWYDMWGGWFDDPEIYSLISVMNAEMEYSLDHPAESVSPVAWLIADDLLTCMAYDFDGTYHVLLESHYNQKESLAKLGVPFDYYYLSDLADGLKKDYDVYIVEAVNVGEEERFAIERYLKRAGKTIVWLGLTGIYDEEGKVSERAMSELIGMDVAFTEGGTYAVTVEDNGHYAAAGLDGFVYGNPASVGKVTPMAYVADQDATALGSFDPLGRTGLAVKEVPVSAVDGWTSVYSAVGNVPAELIRNILEHKGANVYTDSGDVVFANSGYLAVDSPYGGTRTLNLGGTHDVYDVFAGSIVATGVSSFTAHFDAGGTRLFRLTPSSANPQPEPDPQPKPDPPENKATVWPYVLAGGTAAALAAVVAVAIVLKKRKK